MTWMIFLCRCLLMSMIGHTKTYYCSIDLIQFSTKIYKRIFKSRFNERTSKHIYTFWIGKFLFIEKSKFLEEKNQFEKKIEARLVKGLTLTLKIGQWNLHSMIFGPIFIFLVTGFMYYIIVNNTIFFEMTYPCVWMYTRNKRINRKCLANVFHLRTVVLASKWLNILVSVDKWLWYWKS